MSKISSVFSYILFILFGLGTSAYYYVNTVGTKLQWDTAHMPGIEKFTDLTSPYYFYILLAFLALAIPLIIRAFAPRRYISIGILSIGAGFLWVLWLTCVFTTARHGLDPLVWAFATVGVWANLGSVLGTGTLIFFKILGYLALPAGVLGVSLGLGTWGLRMLKIGDSFESSVRLGVGVIFGFSVLVNLISIIGFFGLYNLMFVYTVLILGLAIGGRDLWTSLGTLWSYRASLPESSLFAVLGYILSGGFLTITWIVMSVNFINILRPFPIGWDDLGVYMNYPKLIANSENTMYFGMSFWQNLNGVGFLHGSASLAFFLNSLGGILAAVLIFVGIKYTLARFESEDPASLGQKYLMSLPLFAVAAYMAMPMVVFQLAKDMKVDSGLLALSIAALICLLEAIKSEARTRKILLILSGVLMGVAFATKFTTLMLILGGLAVIWYAHLRVRGFLIYLTLFIGGFSILGLWKFLNISAPVLHGSSLLIFCGVVVCLIAGLYASALWQRSSADLWKVTQNLLLDSLLLITGIVISLAPWIVKNTAEVYMSTDSRLGINTLLGGQPKVYNADMLKILTPEAKKATDARLAVNTLDADGNTKNEDLGRYFGYEKGISNYLKLPLNLTLQTNQWGEFTDIGPLYLILLPGAFLLLLSGLWPRVIGFGVLAILGGVYFLPSWQALLSSLANEIQLPIGYLVVVILGLIPVGLVALDDHLSKKSSGISAYLGIFLSVYILIFVLAAFGIVWYGILLYFGLLATIVLGFSRIMNTRALEWIGTTILCSGILLAVLFPYFFGAVLVQAWNNMPEDLPEYRQGLVSEEEAIFLSRPEYVPLLEAINITSGDQIRADILTAAKTPELKALLTSSSGASLASFNSLLTQTQRIVQNGGSIGDIAVAREARDLRNLLFQRLLYPPKESINDAPIYRVGTFTSYYVARNRERFFEDSLIYQFDSYIQGKDRETSIDNLEKLGMKYILMDLNAATIDRDPRKDLTRRFEWLLDLARSPRLELITTDSPCMELALTRKDDPQFLSLAWVNYDSYARNPNDTVLLDPAGNTSVINALSKQKLCLSTLSKVMKEDAVKALIPRIQRSYMAAFRILPRAQSSSVKDTTPVLPTQK